MENYFEVESRSPLYKQFIFIDSDLDIASRAFKQHHLNPKIINVYNYNDAKFSVKQCKINRHKVPEFKKAMEDLDTALLRIHMAKYVRFRDMYAVEMNKEESKEESKKND